MATDQTLNLYTLEPWEDDYSKAKKKEVSGNTSYYDAPGKAIDKFYQWQLDAMNTPTVVPVEVKSISMAKQLSNQIQENMNNQHNDFGAKTAKATAHKL
ncbi:hypothetical protein [Ralstonia mannitolilytica]|uniref:hypothetical protein n=1 Tax=Ralstonia mannitolilytica TaxID=105219 RepID=UPI001C967C98|nr:hypothetical protein [Ralstonia mannitolilytica]MBY4717557.1 hypothetical protein [Ralstonia mannitolilytica]